MIRASLSEVKDQFPSFVKRSNEEDVIIMENGRAVAVLKGFEGEDDYFDYQLENDPRFLDRIARSRQQIKEGKFTCLEDIPVSAGERDNSDILLSPRQRPAEVS